MIGFVEEYEERWVCSVMEELEAAGNGVACRKLVLRRWAAALRRWQMERVVAKLEGCGPTAHAAAIEVLRGLD